MGLKMEKKDREKYRLLGYNNILRVMADSQKSIRIMELGNSNHTIRKDLDLHDPVNGAVCKAFIFTSLEPF